MEDYPNEVWMPDSLGVPKAPSRSVAVIVLLVLLLLCLVGIGLMIFFTVHNKKRYSECNDDRSVLETRLKACCSVYSAGEQSYCEGYSIDPVIGRPVPDVIGRPVPDRVDDGYNSDGDYMRRGL